MLTAEHGTVRPKSGVKTNFQRFLNSTLMEVVRFTVHHFCSGQWTLHPLDGRVCGPQNVPERDGWEKVIPTAAGGRNAVVQYIIIRISNWSVAVSVLRLSGVE